MEPLVSVDKQAKPYQHVGYGALRTLNWEYSLGFTSGTDVDLINSAIWNRLLTPKGRWRWNPNFGSNLYKVVFEPNDEVAAVLGQSYIEDDLQQEKRVTNVTIRAQADNYELRFFVSYKISETNQEGNLVIAMPRQR